MRSCTMDRLNEYSYDELQPVMANWLRLAKLVDQEANAIAPNISQNFHWRLYFGKDDGSDSQLYAHCSVSRVGQVNIPSSPTMPGGIGKDMVTIVLTMAKEITIHQNKWHWNLRSELVPAEIAEALVTGRVQSYGNSYYYYADSILELAKSLKDLVV